jgi:hypothetical protein
MPSRTQSKSGIDLVSPPTVRVYGGEGNVTISPNTVILRLRYPVNSTLNLAGTAPQIAHRRTPSSRICYTAQRFTLAHDVLSVVCSLAGRRMSLKTTTALPKMGLLSAMLCCFALAQENASSGVPSLTSIIQAMEKAQSGARAQAPYQVIREYRILGANNASADSVVVAEVDFKPAGSQNYNVQRRSGSVRGEQVVRRILDHEVEASAKRNQPRTAGITSDNYDFTYLGETVLDGQPCYLLGLKPKRKEKDLISGEAWVDKHSLLVRHIEGEIAKTPSWWLKSVRVKLVFADVEGTWLQTSMEAVADVRILGRHTLTSRILDYRGTDVVAFKTPAPSGMRSRDRKHKGPSD